MRSRAIPVVLGALVLAGCDLILGVNDLVYTGPGDADASDDALVADAAPGDAGDGGVDARGQDDAGCDADVASDPGNCGACGHSCLGGACDAGVCQPVLLATGTGLVSLASDGTTLALRDTSTIRACPVTGCADGGAVLTAVTNSVSNRRVREIAGSVLWNDSTHLYQCSKTSCAPVDRLQGTGNTRFVLDFWVSDSIFWVAQSGSIGPYPYTVGKCPLGSGNCTQITSGASDNIGVVAGLGFDAWWTSSSVVHRCTGSCGVDASTATNSALSNPDALDTVDGGLFAGYSAGVAWLSTDLATALPIANLGYVTRLVASGADVFFVDASARKLERCPAVATACNPSVLAQTSTSFDDLAADAKAVYWIEGQSKVWRRAR